MSIGSQSRSVCLRVIRWLKFGALILTTAALLLCLQFVLQTNALTLFLFSSAGPVLVVVSVSMVLAALLLEYRLAHSLFDLESIAEGKVVFTRGEPGDCAYFIRVGEVEVVDEGSGTVLARLGPGEYFGEMALLANAPRNATVKTLTDVELATLCKENFLSMVKLLPATEEAVLETVRKRAMGARSQETDLSRP